MLLFMSETFHSVREIEPLYILFPSILITFANIWIYIDTREGDLMALFTEYGSVAKINMPIDRETGRPRGFAFVNMSNAEEHAAAIAALNESEVGGRTIYVSESVPKEKYAANKDMYDATRKPSKFCTLADHDSSFTD